MRCSFFFFIEKVISRKMSVNALFFPFGTRIVDVGSLSVLFFDLLIEIFKRVNEDPRKIRLVCKGFDVLSRQYWVMLAWKKSCYETLTMKKHDVDFEALSKFPIEECRRALRGRELQEFDLRHMLSIRAIPDRLIMDVVNLAHSKGSINVLAMRVLRKFLRPSSELTFLATSTVLKKMHSAKEEEVLGAMEVSGHSMTRGLSPAFEDIWKKLLNSKSGLVRAKAIMQLHHAWLWDNLELDFERIHSWGLTDSDSRVVSAVLACLEDRELDLRTELGIISGDKSFWMS